MTHIEVRGEVDQRAVDQLVRCAEAGDAPAAALCADGHVGYSQPIGGVVAYRDYISPSGVGYDIGCGNKAVATNLFYGDIRKDMPKIMDEIVSRISFGVGRVNDEPLDDPVFDHINQTAPHPAIRAMLPKARKQLGTVGAGNHYVDLFREEGTDRVWVGVHFGSRGFGHGIASGFLRLANNMDFDSPKNAEGEMDSPPVLLRVDSALGYMYIEAMTLAGEFAYAGRNAVCDKVLEILGAQSFFEVHNHHNYAWQETHLIDGKEEELWVVRKGCTPAFPGQYGFIGATMGEPAVIVKGAQDAEASAESLLYSTVHGAGRLMSRTQAAGKMGNRAECTDRNCTFWVPWKEYLQAEEEEANASPSRLIGHEGWFTLCPHHPQGRMKKRRGRIRDGAINFDQVRLDVASKGIVLRGGAADEAPKAYKRLSEVLAYHADTIEIVNTLIPVGVAMAGSDTYDPWKD